MHGASAGKMSLYDVPLVANHLSAEEMVTQMADVIDYLTAVSSDLFAKISDRVADTKARISRIDERTRAANEKIGKLTGSRKATRVFSSSRFPGSFHSEVPLIYEGERIPFKRTKTQMKKSLTVDDSDEFFYPQQGSQGVAKHGAQLSVVSVSELLIFNSENIAFLDSSSSEKLARSLKRKADLDNSEEGILGDAPWSISQREQLESSQAPDYFYIPGAFPLTSSFFLKCILAHSAYYHFFRPGRCT